MSARARLVVAAVVAGAVIAGGSVMERRIDAGARPAVETGPEVTGAWFCPHGGGQGWHAWVVVSNPAEVPADVAVTSRVGPGPPQVARSIVPPRAHVYLEVPATDMAAASVVEFFGTTVAAGMVTARPDAEGGVAAEPCAERSATRWFVPEASTLRGQEASIVVHNPFATEAVIDVGLITGKGTIRHGRLKGLVLAPGQVTALPVGEFALGEQGLAASVTALLGRVVVAGVTVSPAGVRSVVGTAAPASRWLLPGTGDPATGRLVVAGAAGEAAFRADAQGEAAQTPLVDLESVVAGAVATFDVDQEGGGLLVQAEGRQPLVAGRMLAPPAPPAAEDGGPKPGRKEREGGGTREGRQGRKDRTDRKEPAEPPAPEPTDLAATGGAPVGADRWLTLPATGPEGGPAALVLQNPGGEPAEVTLTLLGGGGEAGTPPSLEVAPGTAVRLDLPSAPAAVLVEAAGGRVVPAQVSLDPRAYAVSVGVPLD